VRRGRRGAERLADARLPPAVPLVAVLVAGSVLLSGCSGSTGGPSAATTKPPSSVTSSGGTTTTTTTTPSPPASKAPPAKATTTRLSVVPASGPGPTVRFPAAPAAVGTGANATVSHVPDSVWARMVGYSWTAGCPVGRASLRLVQVNYWGFDGVRHRGRLVVASAIATRAASAFSSLYGLKFRIRQMRPMDSTWGHNPKGPGADDYAAMRADNTSAFNCRYVGGEESRKVWSNHAYGRAIDINDYENPYVASNGTVYPSSYYLHRRSGPGVFTSSGSAAVRAFTRLGFTWGGTWRDPDFQHMELR
jgi:D-alanyl-D-alanine carboxypeptidase